MNYSNLAVSNNVNMSLATLKPSTLTHICANYTYNHVLYDPTFMMVS